jgi:hypothetical protein
MIVFGRIRKNPSSKRRYYYALFVTWLYVLAWLGLGYLILVWDIKGYYKFFLELLIIGLAPWPLKGLFQSYEAFVKEQAGDTDRAHRSVSN